MERLYKGFRSSIFNFWRCLLGKYTFYISYHDVHVKRQSVKLGVVLTQTAEVPHLTLRSVG
jgi:hypothetical protein